MSTPYENFQEILSGAFGQPALDREIEACEEAVDAVTPRWTVELFNQWGEGFARQDFPDAAKAHHYAMQRTRDDAKLVADVFCSDHPSVITYTEGIVANCRKLETCGQCGDFVEELFRGVCFGCKGMAELSSVVAPEKRLR